MTTAVTQQAKVGDPVSVASFTGKHVVNSTMAHVIAVGPVDEKTGHPTVTVAFPKTVDEAGSVVRQLSSARWHDAYVRQTGVQHYTHPDVRDGKLSVAYANEGDNPTQPLIPQPEGTGDNPIYDRNVLDPSKPKVSEAIAAQQGKLPEGSHASPVTSEAGTLHNATTTTATATETTATADVTGNPSTTAAATAAPQESETRALQNLAAAVEGKPKKS